MYALQHIHAFVCAPCFLCALVSQLVCTCTHAQLRGNSDPEYSG